MLHRFTKSAIHTSDQPSPPWPYVGERRHTTKVSNGTSNSNVGNSQEICATDLGEYKVYPIGDDGLTDAKWMDSKHGTESASLRLKIDKCGGNKRNPKVGNGRQATSICQYIYLICYGVDTAIVGNAPQVGNAQHRGPNAQWKQNKNYIIQDNRQICTPVFPTSRVEDNQPK